MVLTISVACLGPRFGLSSGQGTSGGGLGLMSVTPHTDASTRVCEALLKVSEPSEG